MKPTFFISSAIAVALLTSLGQAAKLTQTTQMSCSNPFMDKIPQFEHLLPQTDSMTESEAEAIAHAIVDAFLEG